jgi:hypothetical protein
MEEIDLFVVDNLRDVVVLVVDAESGCWFAKIHLTIGVMEEVALVVIDNRASRHPHCQSHLLSNHNQKLPLPRLRLRLLLLPRPLAKSLLHHVHHLHVNPSKANLRVNMTNKKY